MPITISLSSILNNLFTYTTLTSVPNILAWVYLENIFLTSDTLLQKNPVIWDGTQESSWIHMHIVVQTSKHQAELKDNLLALENNEMTQLLG